MLYFAFAQAVFGKFEFDCWVVECGKFVMHGLHDLEAFAEVGESVLCSSECGSESLEWVDGAC